VVHFLDALKSDKFCGTLNMVYFVGTLKSGLFCGSTEKWSILWGH
jgi:hypothetical protein